LEKKDIKARALIAAAAKPMAIFLKFNPLNINNVIKPKTTTRELNLTKYASAKTSPVIDDKNMTLGHVFCLVVVATRSSESIRRSPWSHSGEAEFRPPQKPT
jgi:hypothetical protein